MRSLVALTGLAALLVAGCGDQSDDDVVVLFAASSLADLAEGLVAALPPDIDVELVLGGSSSLASQIGDGAPADLFMSADRRWAETVALTCAPACSALPFATNSLVIAVPSGNPAGVVSLEDLARPDLEVVVCSPEVPCGDLTVRVATASGVEIEPDSLEPNVRAVRSRLELDEADVGLIYTTDVSDAVDVIRDERVGRATTTYHLVVVAPDHGHTAALVARLSGPVGRALLEELGFGSPS